MANNKNDETLFTTLRSLSTAVVGDILDTLNYHHQFLPPGISPLKQDSKLIGRAMPVLEADVYSTTGDADSKGPLATKPFGLMMEALDDLQPDEVYVATGGTFRYALWGGLMTTRAQHLNAAGALLNGYVRDAEDIERLGFTVFSRGLYAQDQGARGKVIDYRCAIEIEGVKVRPGDLVFGDREGVLIVPREVEQEVIEKAQVKANTENKVAEAIKDGMSASEAFSTFGVL